MAHRQTRMPHVARHEFQGAAICPCAGLCIFQHRRRVVHGEAEQPPGRQQPRVPSWSAPAAVTSIMYAALVWAPQAGAMQACKQEHVGAVTQSGVCMKACCFMCLPKLQKGFGLLSGVPFRNLKEEVHLHSTAESVPTQCCMLDQHATAYMSLREWRTSSAKFR